MNYTSQKSIVGRRRVHFNRFLEEVGTTWFIPVKPYDAKTDQREKEEEEEEAIKMNCAMVVCKTVHGNSKGRGGQRGRDLVR